MRKRFFITFGILLVALAIITFATNRSETPPSKAKTQTPAEDTLVAETTVVPETNNGSSARSNDTLTDIANFIAGIKTFKTSYLGDLTKDSSWQKYAVQIERTWKKLDTVRYDRMENWAEAELAPLANEHYNLFYPFSGPDFLNADLFFPGADTITMFGLEPVGTLPAVSKENFKDSLGNYVGSLKKSLNNVLNLSFFITKHMFSDLRASELNGATHLLLWFAARRQYSIAQVRPVALNFNGHPVTTTDTGYIHSRIKGIEIVCVKDNRTKVIRYFSADISNYGFKKNPRMEKFLVAQHFSTTLVKSASYLMHASNFSVVRNFILNNSQRFLQDDTGIPYKYFANNKWDITLFGEYEKPIKIFLQNYQDDLKKAYDSLDIKKLPFGIGYKYRQNESTWILASKQKLTAKR